VKMGISGLLPFLKNASRPVNVGDFKGCTVAIDVYCWLHKGAFGCAEQLVRGEQTDGYIKYVMKYCNLLLHHGLKPILVFDGRDLPSKDKTETERRKRRRENKEKAAQFLREGRNKEARECMQRCIDITPEMAHSCILACRERNIDCIVAPYEADAQLAFLNISGIAQIVITEDSDLTLFGCDRIMFKLNDSGDCVLYEKSSLPSVFGLRADCFTFDKFRYMCIMSGCDYLSSLKGVGLVNSKNFWTKVSNPDVRAVLPKIPCYLKKPSLIVDQNYIDGFVQADNTFLYQLIFDPATRTLRPLTDYPSWKKASDFPYCGEILDQDTSYQMALGNLDLHSLRKVDHFNPDIQQPFVNPKYGARANHASMWNKNYKMTKNVQKVEVGRKLDHSFTKGKEVVVSTAFGDFPKKTGQGQIGPKKKFLESSTYKLAEKRKVLTYDEETIEAQLMNDEEEPEKEPLAKKIRIDDEASKKNIKTVSKYFGVQKAEVETPTIQSIEVNNDSDEEEVPNKTDNRNRRTTIEDSGNWFESIEVGASHEGKFIYRTDQAGVEKSDEKENNVKQKKESLLNKFKAVPRSADLKQGTTKVLTELSSSGSENGSVETEEEEKTRKRNPFAVKISPKKDEEEKVRKRNPFAVKLQKPSPTKSPNKESPAKTATSTPLDGHHQFFSQNSDKYELFSQKSVEIPASQLSMYSMDSDSLNFTPSNSQVFENDEEDNSDDKCSNTSNVKKVSPVLRIGLSRNFSGSNMDGLSEKSKRVLNGTPISSPSAASPFFTGSQKVRPGTSQPLATCQTTGLSSQGMASSSSKGSVSGMQKFGPARVSGLSKKQKPGGGGGPGQMKQPSVLAMFTRQPKRADL